MKAARWHGRRDVRIEEVSDPLVGQDEVKLEILWCGICGTDVHEYLMGPILIPMEPHPLTGSKAPVVIGHEFGGRVVKVGKEVKNVKLGDRVSVDPLLSCEKCYYCKQDMRMLCASVFLYGLTGDGGGFAEYSVVKGKNCYPIPEGMPDEMVAFGEPTAVGHHSVNRAEVKEGDVVVVIGAGPIGVMVAQFARIAGAREVILTEIAERRIERARALGFTVFDPAKDDILKEVQERTEGRGADVSIECAGGKKTGFLKDTGVHAIELTRPAGRVVLAGDFDATSEIHFNNICWMQKYVTGAFAWREKEFPEGLDYLASGKVQFEPLITKRIKLDNLVEGIHEIELRKDEHLKILVSPK